MRGLPGRASEKSRLSSRRRRLPGVPSSASADMGARDGSERNAVTVDGEANIYMLKKTLHEGKVMSAD